MDREILTRKVEEIQNKIYTFLPEETGRQRDIIEAMNYSVMAGGKRLRPMLMFETAKLFSTPQEDIYAFMAAIEFIHTYSLVHDDLPAMDDDDYRRGKLTTHKKYGHAAGILAGDGLLNFAYEICAEAIVKSSHPDRAAKAFAYLSRAAGVYGMVGGQSVDVAMTKKPLDEETLDFIYELKTGALIKASMVTGAMLAGAEDESVAVIERIASLVGRAFQIQDDVLDVTSSIEELGKPVLSDEKNEKTTYVTLYGIEESKRCVKALSDEAIELLEGLPGDKEFLRDLILDLINRTK